MRLLSNTGMRIWRNCARQYRHEYITLRAPAKKADVLSFGSAWDLALQAWWKESGAQARLLASTAVLERELRDEFLRAKAVAMMVGYSAMWGDALVRCVATQVEFVAPIVHPETGETHPEFALHGVLDAVIELDGRLCGLESKTTSENIEPGSAYWQRVVTLDSQVSGYLAGAKSAGYPIASMIYDVAAKPALRPKKGETAEAYRDRCAADIAAVPGSYLQRHELVRLARDEREYALDVWAYAEAILAAERSGRFPRNPDHCRQYGRACEWLPVCLGEADIDDPVLYRPRERKNHHGIVGSGSEGQAA